jgi:hypothetical protein
MDQDNQQQDNPQQDNPQQDKPQQDNAQQDNHQKVTNATTGELPNDQLDKVTGGIIAILIG